MEDALHLLDLDAESPLPSPEETATAIDLELEAAVRQSSSSQLPATSSELDDLYANLLAENPPPKKDSDDLDWWAFGDFSPGTAAVSPRAATLPASPSHSRPPLRDEHRPAADFDWVEAPTADDTIAALTDLIPHTALETSADANAQTWESLPAIADDFATEESYLHASPEENLLPNDESDLEAEEDLQLDPSILEKLESDLHRLEESDVLEPEDRQPTDAELDAIFPAFSPEEPPAPIADLDKRQPSEDWYLGLDVGTTGISAVLLHRPTAALYPMYWWKSEPPHPPERVFRLPATAYLSLEKSAAEIVAVGFEALNLQAADTALGDANPGELLLQGFDACLNAGLCWTDDDGQSQPIVQWSPGQALPMQDVCSAVEALLSTLGQNASAYDLAAENLRLTDLDLSATDDRIPQLAGIAIGIGNLQGEAYRFNLREAIFNAGLVRRPEQVVFLEESIAAVLSALPSHASPHPPEENWQFSPEWGGTTLTIEAGATATELVLVDLPESLEELTYDRFRRQSFPYGGRAIDQDIICQVLLSDRELRSEFAALDAPLLPQPGEPDLATRIVFEQWLHGSTLGQFLLQAAIDIKVRLPEQERLTVEWGDRTIRVRRRDVESRVLVAYVQRLNRELNGLLSRTGASVEGITQALCTGGNASWTAIARWLRQKLPNATIAQDIYPSGRSVSCSRVAYGLAALPLYRSLVGTIAPHYSDYFLLRELLETFPNSALSVPELLPLLERRGINVRVCQPRILAFLDGELPPGLVPTEPDARWLTPGSRQHPLYEALRLPPFECVGERIYRPHPDRVERLRQYLHRVTADTVQTLNDPTIMSLGVGQARLG